MNFVSLENMISDIRGFIPELAIHDFDLIVGIPRSGMIPAYTIGLYLNIDVTDVSSFVKNVPLQRGISREKPTSLKLPQDAKKILLVDDSYTTGKSLANTIGKIPMELRNRIVSFALYTTDRENHNLDMFIRVIKYPRLFEWNILNHSIIGNSCLDIDGVLCMDPTDDDNDDGQKYITFLENAKPKFIPKVKIKYLVTNRLEKYRTHTEKWLSKNNVKYEQLIMLDLKTKEERIRSGLHSTHKAKFYKHSGCSLFIESDVKQAYEIMMQSGLPVYCIDDNTMYKPGMTKYFTKQPGNALKKIILWLPILIYKNIPKPYQKIIRRLIKK